MVLCCAQLEPRWIIWRDKRGKLTTKLEEGEEEDILVPSVLLLLKAAAAERGMASVIRDTEKGSGD